MAKEALKENTNCLEGMRCPNCGNTAELGIAVTMFVTMTDDGSDPFGDSVRQHGEQDWNNDSVCFCPKCNFSAKVSNFRDSITETSTLSSSDDLIIVLSDRETWETVGGGIMLQVRSKQDIDDLCDGATPKQLESDFQGVRLVDLLEEDPICAKVLGIKSPEQKNVVIDLFGGKADIRNCPEDVMVTIMEHDPLTVELNVEGGVVEVDSLPKGVRVVIDDKDVGSISIHGED